MAIIASKFAQRVLPTLSGQCAGDKVVQQLFMDLTAAQIVANDIIDLGVLPAYHTVVDAVLIPDDLDTNGTPTITLDVGVMSGDPGDTTTARTCGSELFSASTAAQSGTPVRMSAKTGFLIQATEVDRSIGVKFAAGAATAAAGRVRLLLTMAQVDHKVAF